MKLLSYKYNDIEQVGVISSDENYVYPIKSLGYDFNSMQELIDNISHNDLMKMTNQVKRGINKALPFDKIEILSPLPIARDIICIGFNFENHAKAVTRLRGEEISKAKIDNPIYFSKRIYNPTPDGGSIPYIPGYADNLDFGVELAVIIAEDILNISQEHALDYVFGYTIANDVCDTRINKIYTQPFLGKSLDGYLPLGPWIVTADEFKKDEIFQLRLSINGELVQYGTTEQLTFSIPYMISELSRNMTLKAGTIILTGSPANREPSILSNRKIKPGDIVTCEIKGIGCLSNKVEEREQV